MTFDWKHTAALLISLASATQAVARAEEPSVVVPLMIDGRKEAELLVQPNTSPTRFLIDSKPLLQVTSRYLPVDRQTQLASKVDEAGFISFRTLTEFGITPRFDEKMLELYLEIPPERRRLDSISAYSRRIQRYTTPIEPAPFSGYANLRGSQSVEYKSGNQPMPGGSRQPLNLDLDITTQYRGFTLEAETDFLEKRDYPVQRVQSRIVYDDRQRLNRYKLGDFSPQTSGFQSSRNLGGISVTREFSIEPYRIFTPTGDQQILLKRPSTVEILVNGAMIKRLELPAGQFNLKDYPLIGGVNEVQLRIRNDLGESETISVSVLYDSHLLSPGVHQFSYNLGFPSQSSRWDRSYNTSRPVFSLYHRYGFTPTLTGGLNLQGDKSTQVVGAEATTVVPVGTLSFDLAGSGIFNASTDLRPPSTAARGRFYSFEFLKSGFTRSSVNLGAEYRSPGFRPVGEEFFIENYRWTIDASLQNRITDDLRLGLGTRFFYGTGDAPSRRSYQIDLFQHWSSAVNSGIAYSYGQEFSNSHRVLLTVNLNPGGARDYVTAYHDTSSSATRVDWNHSNANTLASLQTSIGVQNDANSSSAEARADYTRPRFTVRGQHRTSYMKDGRFTENQSIFGFGTALVWTDSSVALSKPVTDSFVMIAPKGRSLASAEVPVNGTARTAEAVVDSWGPAVLPSIQSYTEVPISLDTTRLPPGLSISPEFSVVRPYYKSGATIFLQNTQAFAVIGVLQNSRNQPMKFVAGKVRPASASPEVTTGKGVKAFFTNEQGGFMIEGLEPGAYQIDLNLGAFKTVDLVIPENIQAQDNIVPVGTLTALEVE